MHPKSEFTLRPMRAADLPAVLDIQAQCYGAALVETAAALASRLDLSPSTCWISGLPDGTLAAYLFTHAWPETSLPPWNGALARDWRDSESLTWFVHDMAVAPIGRGAGLAAQLYEAAREVAWNAGLRSSRLVAVQDADGFWRKLGYAPVARHSLGAKLATYGEGAVLMECGL
ncbi:GNAT family N-acetyltransferase [Cupriavidus sp. DL-D2]|uniref:GNAT family N-acetyltransferase n=1 Tax=Cupriavidus sp. DL-D2 TaxID=3144974 RepID=UPI003212745E